MSGMGELIYRLLKNTDLDRRYLENSLFPKGLVWIWVRLKRLDFEYRNMYMP
jgi:hypothetical protein